jgi:hypothetical protein
MKKFLYICTILSLLVIISCDKSELESPVGEMEMKALGAEEGRNIDRVVQGRNIENIRSGGDDVEDAGDDINDDGDDETGQPVKKD